MEYPKRVGNNRKSLHRKDYRDFRGVDFSSAREKVSGTRSSDAVNTVVDEFGHLVKRPGFRTVGKYAGKINGIHRLERNGRINLVVHAGDSLWLHSAEPRLLIEKIGEGISFSIVCRDRLWILTGSKYLVFDGERVFQVTDIAYVPTIKIACQPQTGAGTVFEAVNLLSDYRKICFGGDGETKKYLVDDSGYDSVISAMVNGRSVTFSEDIGKRTVTFLTPPSCPAVSGTDNVEIVYKKHMDGNTEMIEKCTFMGLYGIGGADSDRVFFGGNPEKRNVDWHCGISEPKFVVDPTYVPDTSFAYIGADSCGMIGYRRLGNYQVIIKEQNDQDASMFLRKGGIDESGEAFFSLTQGASGIGGIAPHSLTNLGDEPLFLSQQNGVCAVTVNQVTGQVNTQNRSWFVDSKLINEKNLEKAVAVEWKGKYILCINGRIYGLDNRQSKSYSEHSGSGYIYECFFWDGVPAVCLCESDGNLFFGTEDGCLCKFNTDLHDDCGIYRDILSDGTECAISAHWATADSDDGYMGSWKKSVSRQLAILVRNTGAAAQLGLDMSFDGNPWEHAALFVPKGNFDFDSVDFSALSFETVKIPRAVGVGKKPGRYITAALRIKNANMGENLLCDGITQSYYIDKKMKG